MQEHIDDGTWEKMRQLAGEQRQRAEARQTARDRSVMMSAIIERARRSGFRPDDQRVRWHLDRADELLAEGLVRAMGERARWLPEYDEVADWLSDNRGQGLLLIGTCGRGKTVISRDVLPWLFGEHILCDLNGNGTLSHPVYHYYKADRDLKAQFDTICRSRLICIDDIGTEQTRYYGREENWFDRLVQGDRFERDQLMVCSTNLTYEQLFGGEDPLTHINYPARYDERTRSRLLGCCRRIFFEGDDLRQAVG
jgi:DNA replication protein DnaC